MKLSKSPLLLSEPLCLRATGAGIEEIDLLGSDKINSLALYISSNKIKTIENIVQFKHLQTFLAENNLIQYFEDLKPLSELHNLKIIRLEGNPLMDTPYWAFYLIYICPSLVSINGERISKILGNYTLKDIKNHFLNEESKLNFISQLLFLSQLIQSGKYPLKIPYSAEFNKLMPKERLYHLYSEIRNNGPDHSLRSYRKYINQLALKRAEQLIDMAEENGLPGDLLQELSACTADCSKFLSILKNFLAPQGDDFDVKNVPSVSSFKLGNAAESVLSMMKFKSPEDNDRSSRRSYISGSPAKKYDNSKNRSISEIIKQNQSEISGTQFPDKQPCINPVENEDIRTENPDDEESELKTQDLETNSKTDTKSSDINDHNSESTNNIENEDAVIEVSALNFTPSTLMRPILNERVLFKTWVTWKSKVKARTKVDATQMIENPNSISKEFSSIENQLDVRDGVAYLMRKHALMIDIERNTVINKAMHLRKRQFSNEMEIRSPKCLY